MQATGPFLNLAHLLDNCGQKWGDKKAFTVSMANGMEGSLTFAQTNALSDAFAIALVEKFNLKKGERVAIQLVNCLAYPIAAFGVLKAGGVVVNTNPLYTPSEMRYQFSDSGARILIIIDLFCDKLTAIRQHTQIEHVICASVADFFPFLQKNVIEIALKYFKRQVPKPDFPVFSLSQVVAEGQKLQRKKKINVQNYWQSLEAQSLCLLQYTGGTTGISKGAMLTHNNLMANVEQIMDIGKVKIAFGRETVLTVLPLYHIFAFSVNLLTFYRCGAHNILIPNPRPLLNIKKPLEKHKISWICGVNTLFNSLLDEPWFQKKPPRFLKISVAGGASLHKNVADRWLQTTQTQVVEGFGLTEASPVVCFNPIDGRPVKPGTVGLPLQSTEIILLNDKGQPVSRGEIGEIGIKGPQVMLGYWQRPEESEKAWKNGWLMTGDLGYQDTDGYLSIVDRKKDLILVSGFNVYPNEVEECIALMKEVQDVAVVGVPHHKTGEAVKAYVVSKPGSMLTADLVLQHCQKHLAAYKIPKSIEFKENLPKSPIGKILRKELRQKSEIKS